MLPALLLSLAAAGPLPMAPVADDPPVVAPPADSPIVARVKAAVGPRAADKPFLLVVSLTAKEGRGADLIAAYRGAAAKSLAEPGCTSYALSRDAENPNSFLLYERWKSADALASHLEQPYTQAFIAQFGELLTESSVSVMRTVPMKPGPPPKADKVRGEGNADAE